MKSTRNSGLFLTVQGTNLIKVTSFILLFMVLVFSISGLLTSLKPQFRPMSNSVNTAANQVNGKMLYQLMAWENHHFLSIEDNLTASPKLTNLIFKLSSNINLNDPRSLLGRELPGFFQFDGKIVVAGEGSNYTNMPMESAPPIEIMQAEREASLQNLEGIDQGDSGGEKPSPSLTTGEKKVVHLYFTHNRESYLPYLQGVTDPDLAYHSQLNVTKIGDKLKESLEARGIGTSVDKTDIMGTVKMPVTYRKSGELVQTAMAQNREIQYLIDIHRDARRKDKTTPIINGQAYAQLVFVVGGNNPNHEKNEKLATDLHNLLQEKYKGISWGVLKKAGAGSNGVYNQNLSENALLIEFGGVDNTFEEINRSAEALADVFSEYFWQAEKVNAEPSTDKQ
ncbi:stage II sporulation protein P [Neobacillus sp. CF12]|jgi:stage II sporulation protein P|uniref:stage II sporulation protein P n=1 Tax=Neobacillus sp. CF12 TaxID=3055864 RepID=UPI0025A0CA50|nr:stage II sporulation protein P [Neobacillus sp. CF12]MDM5330951.1 stage II sporulation protein P [Neobacillus sp. CF12]